MWEASAQSNKKFWISSVGRGLGPAGHLRGKMPCRRHNSLLFSSEKSENVPFSAAGASPRPTVAWYSFCFYCVVGADACNGTWLFF